MARHRPDAAAARSAAGVRFRLTEDLERLCRDSGVTQTALALAASVPQPYVSRILAGTARPSLETYAKLATALGADLSTRIYPNTGPAIRDRHQARIVETMLELVHHRWQPFVEVAVRRPVRGWIDVVLHEPNDHVIVATEVQSGLHRIEQLIRWSGDKADALPSWDGWGTLGDSPAISRLLVVRWTRTTRQIARECRRQLEVAYPGHPDDALAALGGTATWPGPSMLWARFDAGVRIVSGR